MNNALNSLQGARILVTRAQHQANAFIEQIHAHGGVAVEVPLLMIAAPKHEDVIREAFFHLNCYDWVIITSSNGVRAFVEYANKYACSEWKEKLPKVAAVGKKTLHALKQHGITVSFVPSSYIADVLYEELAPQLEQGTSILLARGNLARKDLPIQLSTLGCEVDDVIVYCTIHNEAARADLEAAVFQKNIDVVTFTSPSTVRAFEELLQGTDWREHVQRTLFACIGPITMQEAKGRGFPNLVTANEYTVEGLIHMICERLT